jgi:hypothetical protein
MSLPAAGGSNRYGTNHCYGAHLARRCRRAPGPGDVGDYRHKAWIFDFDRGETGDGYTLDEALASEVLLLGLHPTHDSAPDRERVQGEIDVAEPYDRTTTVAG